MLVQCYHTVDLSFSMGSVLAASSPNPPPASGGGSAPGGAGLVTVPPGFTMPPVSAVPPSSGTLGQPGTDAEASRPNPGTFEECHRKCKGLSKAHLLALLLWSHNLCSVYLVFSFASQSSSLCRWRGYAWLSTRAWAITSRSVTTVWMGFASS